MRKKTILSMLLIAALAITFGSNEAKAGLPVPPGLPAPPGLPGSPQVNVNISAYLPAPPGVTVLIEAGCPYYVEKGHRVYLKKKYKHDKHHKKHGHKKGH
jgi:hypothetical protein